MTITHGLRIALPVVVLLATLPASLPAQRHTRVQQSFSYADPALAARGRAVVEEFLRFASRDTLTLESVMRLTTGAFMEKMKPQIDGTPFSRRLEYEVHNIYRLEGTDSSLAVAVSGVGDSLPRFGPLTVEIVLFLVRNDIGEYRISELRRYSTLEQAVSFVQYVDTTTDFPRSLKPEILRERTGVLLGNAQLRAHFLENRDGFAKLVAAFDGRDSLVILGRTDRSVAQLNRAGIDWGAAAETIPQEAIDEYMATASPKERIAMQQQLKRVELIRRAGRDSLAHYARKYRIKMSRIDSAVALMKELRVSFVNAALPWKGAVQLTIGGTYADAIGYFYSPGGELPALSPEEYYYLEEIGDGWWIFRAT